MNKVTLVVISALALGLSGCNSSSGTTEDATPENTTGTITENATVTTGTEAQGTNPGAVPGTVIGEVTSLDLSTNEGADPRGYKIFAGGEADPLLGANIRELLANSYMNLALPCAADNVIEYYPSASLAATTNAIPAYTGTFDWYSSANPEIEDGRREMRIDSFTSGGGEFFVGTINEINHLQNGVLIVGTSTVDDLIVARIVQYEICN